MWVNKIERIAQDNKTMTFVYGPDCTRWKSTFTSGSSTRTILYGNDYERITKNATTRHLHYLDEGTILMTIAGQPDQLLFSCTDNLGSIVKLVDKHGNAVFEATYDVWGKQAVTRNEIGFHRGYTGHEMLPDFNLINMNGRLYDPVIGRFLSPDNFVQLEDFSQNFNRYSYCLNNPLKYTDPSGESFITALIVGAVIGTYVGGTVANNGNYDLTEWDYGAAKTWRYMFWGGTVGGFSGYLGGIVSASSIPFANTTGIACSSIVNSIGTFAYTSGATPITICFGAASYDISNNQWSWLGKKGNSIMENIGYSFGALANLPDMVSLLRGGGENITINSSSTKGPDDEWWGHSSATYSEDGKSLVSIGPDCSVEKSRSLVKTWRNSIKGAKNWDTYFGQDGTWSIDLNNISTLAMKEYVQGVTRWDLLLNSCVGHTTRALWCAGIPTVYAFHPHLLNLQLLVRQLGIYSTPYIYSTKSPL